MKKTLTTLLLTVVILLGLGIVLLASASILQAQRHYNGNPYAFFVLQAKWLFVAILIGVACCKFDYHLWKRYLPLSATFYAVIAILLLLTLLPGIKREINGSYRWLQIGSLPSFQPGEFAKLAIIIMTAVWMNKIGWRTKQFLRGAVVPAALIGILAVLLLLEKDFGALMVVGVLGGALMFIAGTSLWHLLVFAAPGVALFGWKIYHDSTRSSRITDWWNVIMPKDDGTHTVVGAAAHQLDQSILAFKIGGLWGSGFNQSIQKQIYLPESHTDFILAIGGEEFGFFFSIGVLACYVVLLICGIMISTRAPDSLGRLLAFGMVLLLVFQGTFNIAVVTGLLPTKGLALPFISYGGTNLITALFAVGTLFNIGMHIGVHDERIHTKVVRDAVNTL